MHLEWVTQPAWKHLACGYWRFTATELRDASSLLFQPSSVRFDPRSLNTGLKEHPTSLREGWASTMLLHLHRLTAASMHLATTIGGSTLRSSVLLVSLTKLDALLTFQPTLSSVQRSAAAGPVTMLQGRADFVILPLA